MPWLTDGEHTLVDLLDASAQIVLVEPRRMRDRASEILAEEADLAGSLSKTWERDRRRVPAAARALRRPSRRDARGRVDVPAGRRPTGRAGDRGDGMGADLGRRRRPRPPVGRAARRALPGGRRRRHRRFGAPPARAAAQRVARPRARSRRHDRLDAAGRSHRRRSARPRVRAPRRAPRGHLRVRPHRPPPRPSPSPAATARRSRVLRGPAARRLRRTPHARRRSVRRHGHEVDGWHRTRLPVARVQGRRPPVRAVRPDRRGAPLHRRRLAGAAPPRRQRLRPHESAGQGRRARDRAGARRAVPAPGHLARSRLPARHARGSARWRRRSRTTRRPTSSRRSPM